MNTAPSSSTGSTAVADATVATTTTPEAATEVAPQAQPTDATTDATPNPVTPEAVEAPVAADPAPAAEAPDSTKIKERELEAAWDAATTDEARDAIMEQINLLRNPQPDPVAASTDSVAPNATTTEPTTPPASTEVKDAPAAPKTEEPPISTEQFRATSVDMGALITRTRKVDAKGLGKALEEKWNTIKAGLRDRSKAKDRNRFFAMMQETIAEFTSKVERAEQRARETEAERTVRKAEEKLHRENLELAGFMDKTLIPSGSTSLAELQARNGGPRPAPETRKVEGNGTSPKLPAVGSRIEVRPTRTTTRPAPRTAPRLERAPERMNCSHMGCPKFIEGAELANRKRQTDKPYFCSEHKEPKAGRLPVATTEGPLPDPVKCSHPGCENMVPGSALANYERNHGKKLETPLCKEHMKK